MRKQVGNQKKLSRLVTFGSYGKLYHTHFVFVSHKLFCGAAFRPSPLLHAGVTVPPQLYATAGDGHECQYNLDRRRVTRWCMPYAVTVTGVYAKPSQVIWF